MLNASIAFSIALPNNEYMSGGLIKDKHLPSAIILKLIFFCVPNNDFSVKITSKALLPILKEESYIFKVLSISFKLFSSICAKPFKL